VNDDIVLVLKERRHWYRYRGQEEPSVTTILNVLAKPALTGWAARLTAEQAVRERKKLWAIAEADETAAVEWLRQAPWQRKDRAANLGSAVHKLISQGIVTGAADEQPYLDVWYQWLDGSGWTVKSQEFPVFHPQVGYGGTVDLLAVDGDGRLLVADIKTGSGVYPEYALQLAAYRHASVGIPATDGAVVLHVTAEGCRVVEVDAGESTFEAFVAARRLWQWQQSS
jgi:hypothetical protein